jgi:HD superfamily phosphodiesterase
MAEPLLRNLPLADGQREAVLHAVRWHNSGRADSPLLCILRDADMLDGLGAIGLMRGFMSKGHLPPYDPRAPFERDAGGWPASSASDQILGQIKFYHWLNTETARRMAAERFDFMRAFVDQVQRELPDGASGR